MKNFRALVLEAAKIKTTTLNTLFEKDAMRIRKFSIDAVGLYLNYSRNFIDENVFSNLMGLVQKSHLEKKRAAMFQGEVINYSENRAVLHTLLRTPQDAVLSENLIGKHKDVYQVLERIEQLCEKIHAKGWLGYSGKPIESVVNVGIGGSYLGVKTALDALMPYCNQKEIKPYFLSSIDPEQWLSLSQQLNPETTLFIISSKSFSTQETLLIASLAKNWLLHYGANKKTIENHFIAVTANRTRALEFGINEDCVFPVWEWVGGRYSVWSAIGIIIPIILGFPVFLRFLKGAREMDLHFVNAPFEKNMPVIMAALGVWYHSFLKVNTHLVIPYSNLLQKFPEHLQQLEMESNGKCIDCDGNFIDYPTAPFVWGGVGTESQHSFHQLLHQGTCHASIDLIVPLKVNDEIRTPSPELQQMQRYLVANALAQSQALMMGCSESDLRESLKDSGTTEHNLKHSIIPGNRPSSLIMFESLTPEVLGSLFVLYEHKVMTEGILWNINSFDQWGVELGKRIGSSIFGQLTHNDSNKDYFLLDVLERYHDI